jgi:UDP-glucose 4-epimerase
LKILITGARGFVGGNFGRIAQHMGHQVLGIARSSQPDRGWHGDYAQADVASTDLSHIVEKFAPDLVFHGAGSASVGNSLVSPTDDLRAAVATWANTLDSVRRSGVRPLVIFPSSAAIYGNPSALPVHEDMPAEPISPYGFHKAACELLAREYAQCFGLNVMICRLFSLFGASQRRLLVWELYEQISGSEPEVWLQGTGAETRDYLDIEDVSQAILALGARCRDREPDAGCRVVNVASGTETGVLELAHEIARIADSQKAIRCRGVQRPGDPKRWQADNARLRALLPDWRPPALSARLQKCIEAWNAERAEESGRG